MKKTVISWSLAAVCCAAFLATPAKAEVTNLAYWRGGEADSPSPSGEGQQELNVTTVDSSGKGQDLAPMNKVGPGPVYDLSGAVQESRVSLAFDPEAANPLAGTAITTEEANWGIQCYTSATADGTSLISNGDGTAGGFGLMIHNNRYSGVMNGKTILEGTVTPDGNWHNVALVNVDGILFLYVDGVVNVTSRPGGAAPASGFLTIGATFNGNLGRCENFSDGKIDEARIFTFGPGEFVESDLIDYVGQKN